MLQPCSIVEAENFHWVAEHVGMQGWQGFGERGKDVEDV